jgi:hypothetical protein
MVTMSGPAWTIFSTSRRMRQVDVEVLQDIGRHAGTFFDQAQKDMLGADILVVEALRLLIGELHHLASPVGKAFIHFLPSPTPGRLARSGRRPR